MSKSQAPQFGVLPPGQQAEDRPGAYGVIFDAGRADQILLVRWQERYFLPGGGVRPGETLRQALTRELLEETGHEPLSGERIGAAGQYVRDAAARWWNKRCTFFVVRTGRRVREPVEQDHAPAWMLAGDATAVLYEEASSWAVTQALQRRPGA